MRRRSKSGASRYVVQANVARFRVAAKVQEGIRREGSGRRDGAYAFNTATDAAVSSVHRMVLVVL